MRQILPSLLEQKAHGQFARFLLVGCSNFVVSFLVFHLLILLSPRFDLSIFIAQLLSYSAGTLWSFIWNRRFTFRSTASPYRQAVRFIVLQGSFALITAFSIDAAVVSLGLPPTAAWFLVMFVVTIANYMLSRSWAFRR